MCGIAGYTQSSRRLDSSVIHRMTASLAHRGPDQSACRISHAAAIGAVRLQIVDRDGGAQPFASDDGASAIVYNGELYNHAELRDELQSLGHHFRSRCDIEVALKAFLQWDTACFARFRGMFALAIWKDPEKRLVLCRDRMGIKPLYIRRTGRDIVFGSELKALFAHPAVTRRLDHSALQDFLSLNYVPSPLTLVEGIRKLPSGHYLDWRNGKETVHQWWRIPLAPDSTLHEADAVSELDRLLRQSVKEHLMSDGPVGIWASGGVDSTALLHYASELSAAPVRTFSVAFRSQADDESRWFRPLARHYGAVHEEVELDCTPPVIAAIEDMATSSDEPGADAGALPVWFLSKLTRSHVRVALSGEGGDELFGGYLTYRADKLARPLRRLPRLLRSAAHGAAINLLPVSNRRVGFEYKLKRWLEGSLLHPDEAHLFWNGVFSEKQKAALLSEDRGLSPRPIWLDLPAENAVGALNRYLLLDQRYYLQDNLLYKVDRMSMAHSLEVRPPFLDHRIVEFAAHLPERFKIRGSKQKWVLKQALRGKVPKSVLSRPKAGLDIPAHAWFRGPLMALLKDTLSRSSAVDLLFHRNEIDSLIERHGRRQINAGYQLWGLMTLMLWIERWNIEVAAEEPEALAAAS